MTLHSNRTPLNRVSCSDLFRAANGSFKRNTPSPSSLKQPPPERESLPLSRAGDGQRPADPVIAVFASRARVFDASTSAGLRWSHPVGGGELNRATPGPGMEYQRDSPPPSGHWRLVRFALIWILLEAFERDRVRGQRVRLLL